MEDEEDKNGFGQTSSLIFTSLRSNEPQRSLCVKDPLIISKVLVESKTLCEMFQDILKVIIRNQEMNETKRLDPIRQRQDPDMKVLQIDDGSLCFQCSTTIYDLHPDQDFFRSISHCDIHLLPATKREAFHFESDVSHHNSWTQKSSSGRM